MSQAQTIRSGLVANLAPLLTTNGGPLGQITPYPLSSASPPSAHVDGGEVDYDQAMGRGLDELTFLVVVLIPFTVDVASQELLDELRDPNGATSVKTLIESDPTLGGAVDDLHVTKLARPQLAARQTGGDVLVSEWTVQVLATGR